jgi:hypothetical protein
MLILAGRLARDHALPLGASGRGEVKAVPATGPTEICQPAWAVRNVATYCCCAKFADTRLPLQLR